ncbi:cytochrome C oxidase subunit II [Lentibacillus sp. N15]
METTKEKIYKPEEDPSKSSLLGTLVAVGGVAAVIVIMWVAIFWLYMVRV